MPPLPGMTAFIRWLATAAWLLPAAVMADEFPGLHIPRGKGDACVAATDEMRKNHMDYLLHQRDRTVYQGIRGEAFSLTGCIDCHVQKDRIGKFIPINNDDQFCGVCHRYVSVKIDCFDCHASKPDDESLAASGTSQTGKAAHDLPALKAALLGALNDPGGVFAGPVIAQ